MAWRSLLIQNGGKLSLQRRQLLIQQWLPYAQYHRQLKILKLQLNIRELQHI